MLDISFATVVDEDQENSLVDVIKDSRDIINRDLKSFYNHEKKYLPPPLEKVARIKKNTKTSMPEFRLFGGNQD